MDKQSKAARMSLMQSIKLVKLGCKLPHCHKDLQVQIDLPLVSYSTYLKIISGAVSPVQLDVDASWRLAEGLLLIC